MERKLWERSNVTYKTLKQLTRERDQIVASRSVAKNQLQAEQFEAYPIKYIIKRCQELIKLELKEIKDQEIKDKIRKITTISGVGILTATIVLAETNGFELIKLDVKEKQSGTSVKGKPWLSKKGNKSIRKQCIFRL